MKVKLINVAVIALLILILFQVSGSGRRRGLSSFGGNLTTTPGSGMSGGPSSIFDLKNKVGCTASGFNPDSSFYSKSLTPGGLCGDMDFVRNQERDYTIDSGIGGSLLSK